VLLVGSLGRGHPLQSSALVCRREGNYKVDNLALWNGRRQRDPQRGAVRLNAVSNLILGSLSVDLDFRDIKEANCLKSASTILYSECNACNLPAVQHNLLHFLIRQTLKVESNRTAQDLVLEIDLKVHTGVLRQEVVIVRQRIRVLRRPDLDIRVGQRLSNHSCGRAMHSGESSCSNSSYAFSWLRSRRSCMLCYGKNFRHAGGAVCLC
jgi:hypothetical protein